MFEGIFSEVQGIVSSLGPVGIFVAMFVETVFPPIPSEIVMPFGGYIAYVSGQGILGLVLMIVAGSFGSTLGATVIYMIARTGGRKLVLRYGKMFMMDRKRMRDAEGWFERHGSHAVFLCRMAPGLREIISIPAGLAQMNFVKFLSLTFAGSFIWSAFLGSIGFFLADTWTGLDLSKVTNVLALVLVAVFVAYFVFMHVRNGKGKRS